METRRNFIQKNGLVLFGAAAGLAGAEQVSALTAQEKPAMIIDLNRAPVAGRA